MQPAHLPIESSAETATPGVWHQGLSRRAFLGAGLALGAGAWWLLRPKAQPVKATLTDWRVIPHPAGITGIAFNPDDGVLVSTARDGSLRFWSTGDARLLGTVASGAAWVGRPEFMLHDAIFAVPSGRAVQLWSQARRVKLSEFTAPKAWFAACACSPDGDLVAAGTTGGNIHLWSHDDGGRVASFPGHAQGIASMAFSPDGTRLASGSWSGKVKLWSVAERSLEQALTDHGDWVNAVAFSPDGKTLATASWDGTVHLRAMPTGQTRVIIPGHSAWGTPLAFTPDGSLLATVRHNNELALWHTADGTLATTVALPEQHVTSLAFSPRGHFLAAAADEGTMFLSPVPAELLS